MVVVVVVMTVTAVVVVAEEEERKKVKRLRESIILPSFVSISSMTNEKR